MKIELHEKLLLLVKNDVIKNEELDSIILVSQLFNYEHEIEPLIMHLSMMFFRIRNKSNVDAMEHVILEAIKNNEKYEVSLKYLLQIEDITKCKIDDNEKWYVLLHLENILH